MFARDGSPVILSKVLSEKKPFLKRNLWLDSDSDNISDNVEINSVDNTWLYNKHFTTPGNTKIWFYAGNKEDGLSGAKTCTKQVSDYVLKKRYSTLWCGMTNFFFLMKHVNELRTQSPETKIIFDLDTALEMFGSESSRDRLCNKIKDATKELCNLWNSKQKMPSHASPFWICTNCCFLR